MVLHIDLLLRGYTVLAAFLTTTTLPTNVDVFDLLLLEVLIAATVSIRELTLICLIPAHRCLRPVVLGTGAETLSRRRSQIGHLFKLSQ